MGVIKTSKDQSLLVSDSSKAQEKGKSKKKEPKAVVRSLNKINKILKGPSALRRRNLKISYVLIVKRDTILKIIV